MPKLIDITNEKYGRLIVIRRIRNHSGRVSWLCRCDCGNLVAATSNSLRTGKKKSCGCLAKESKASRAKKAGEARGDQLRKHGRYGCRLYGVWKAMRQRCRNPNDPYYPDYGGRGITVCPEWDDFELFFIWALSNGYDPNASFGECTLDRRDNDKGYSPDNCRWVSMTVQANNRRKRKKE